MKSRMRSGVATAAFDAFAASFVAATPPIALRPCGSAFDEPVAAGNAERAWLNRCGRWRPDDWIDAWGAIEGSDVVKTWGARVCGSGGPGSGPWMGAPPDPVALLAGWLGPQAPPLVSV